MPQVLWHVVIDLCGQRWKRGSNAGACGFLESLVAFFLWMEVGHSKYTPPKNNASQPWICLYLSAWLSSKTEKGETFLLTVCDTFFHPMELSG